MLKFGCKFLVLILIIGWSIAVVGSQIASANSPADLGASKESPLYLDQAAHLEERIEDLLSRMTLDEKIGQMTQAERVAITPEEVREYFVGSVFSGGGSAPEPNTPESWADLIDRLQAAALDTRLGIPVLYGSDAVHGHNNLYGATIFPHNIGLGATRDPELLQRIGEIVALETSATAVNWTFAPTVAVVRDIRWGRTYESFGESPELQELLVAPLIKGLQGPENEMRDPYVVATAKHYVADGAALWGTGGSNYKIDQGDVWISDQELKEIHLAGYLEALEAGVGTIMVSFTSYQDVKMHAHRYLITELLKNELNFEGLVVSDWEGIRHIPARDFYTQVVLAANAGIDLFMEPYGWKELITSLTEAVQAGGVSEERIDDAVRRILRVKFQAGLFENPYANRSLLEQRLVGSPAHREVAREAVRKSLVLLKNEGDILPLSKKTRVYVTGSNSDDLGNQCGGWTISWQGGSGPITAGTTILEGIEQVVAGHGEIVSKIEQAEVVVVVIGEKPYAEGVGDDGELSLSIEDLETLRHIKKSGKPVVVVLVSGRPLMIADYIDDWSAFVAAWLPGTEGQGVADVLFGDYEFIGRLPITWPKSVEQLPLNYGDKPYPLFEYGFRLGD